MGHRVPPPAPGPPPAPRAGPRAARAALLWPNRDTFGVLAVIDREPLRPEVHRGLLDKFRRLVESDLEMLALHAGLVEDSQRWQLALESAGQGMWDRDLQ